MKINQPESVRNAAAKGTAIAGGVTVLLRIINFVAALYLLRILEPTDFGLVALAMLVVGALSLFADLGMGPALIYSSHDRRTVAFQAFVMSMGFSGLLSLLVYCNVDSLAALFSEPRLVEVLKYMSFYLFISTASTVPFCMLRKDMAFKQIGYTTFLSECTVTLVQLVLAFLGFGVWSLVAGRIAGGSVRTLTSWWLCPGWDWLRPGRWDWTVHRDLLKYGVQSTGGGVLAYAYSNFDNWLIGRTMGTASLGFYTKAYDLTHTTTNRFSRNIVRIVFFPAYAKIRDNKVRLTRAYLKSLSFILIFMTPLAFGTIALAEDLVRVMFGAKWLPMVPAMQIFAAVILTRPVSENSAPLFQALGKPIYNVQAGLVVLAIMIPLALMFVSMGIVGVALAVAFAHLGGMLFNVYQANTLLKGSAVPSFRLMFSIFLSGALMGGLVLVGKYLLTDGAGTALGIWELILLIACGSLVYVAAIWFTQRDFVMEIVELTKTNLVPKLKRSRKAP